MQNSTISLNLGFIKLVTQSYSMNFSIILRCSQIFLREIRRQPKHLTPVTQFDMSPISLFLLSQGSSVRGVLQISVRHSNLFTQNEMTTQTPHPGYSI